MIHRITIAIDTDQHFGPILVGGRSLAFADAGYMGFMKAIDLVWNMNTTQPLWGLVNHSLDELGVRLKLVFQSLNRTSRFVCFLAVKGTDFLVSMVNHLRNSFHHLLNISADLAQAWVNAFLSVFGQLMNFYNYLLTQSAKTANPFYPLYSVTRKSLDCTNRSTPSSVKKLCIRWILNLLGLGRDIHLLTSYIDPLPVNQYVPDRFFQFSEAIRSLMMSKLGHSGRTQKPERFHFSLSSPSGLRLHCTKAHPVDILVQSVNGLLIQNIKAMLQYVQTNHESNLLRAPASSTVIREQSIGDIIPVNALSQEKKFVVLLKRVLKKVRLKVILTLIWAGYGLVPP